MVPIPLARLLFTRGRIDAQRFNLLPIMCRTHGQGGILEGFSNELPNSQFRNGGISRNWSNKFMIFLDDFTAY